MSIESKIPDISELKKSIFEAKKMVGSAFDMLMEIQIKRRERLTQEAIRSSFNLDEERELRELIAHEERFVAEMERDGVAPSEIVIRRNESDSGRRIKELLRKFSIAKMNKAGDWIVNRKNEIPESMGVVPFKDLMDQISNFQWIYSPDTPQKMVALDVGCGNGEFCEDLRASSGISSGQQWEIYGYADCIYYTLRDFLANLIRPEFENDQALKEFTTIVSTLLLRKIHKIEAFSGQKTDDQKALQDLPVNLSVIRRIMANLEDFIELGGRTSIDIDLEFLSDAHRDISLECQHIIDVYLDDPKAFVEYFFQEDLQDLTSEEKNRLQGIQGQINIIHKSFNSITRSLTRNIRKLSPTEKTSHEEELRDSERQRAVRATIVENRRKINILNQEKEKLLAKIPDLSPYISLYHYNVVLGDFNELDEVIPSDSISFMWAFRSTSHLGDTDYWRTIKNAATRLAPGGVFLDDGKCESWTRFERLEEINNLQDELGSEFSVRIIARDGEAKVVVIERGIKTENGHLIFFSDKFEKEMLAEDCELVDIHEWALALPKVDIRNRIIDVVREVVVDATYEGLRGRMYFKGVHPIIDKIVSEVEQRMIAGELTDLDIQKQALQDRVLAVLRAEAPYEVRKLVEERAVPYQGGGRVSTLRRTRELNMLSSVNSPREFQIKDLPRNAAIPSMEAVKMRTYEMIQDLTLLRQVIGRPPITVCEFDDCFTNKLMVDLLHYIMADTCFMCDVNFADLVRVYNIKLQGDMYAQNESLGVINIIGGSTGDVYDEYGERFTEHFVRPLVEEVAKGAAARFLGVCFGSQSILQAFGKQEGRTFRTVPGALQFGAFPIAFPDSSKPIAKELSGASYTVGMTRSSYSIVDGYESLGEDLIKPLAFEYNNGSGRMEVDRGLPPAAFSLYGGKVVTTQFHPEISLKTPNSRNDLNSWLNQNHQYLKSEFGERGGKLPKHFDLKALSDAGITSWIQRDIGPLFVLNVLSSQIKSLVQDLNLR